MTTFTRPHESGITVESFGWLPNGEAQAFASIVKPSLEVAQRAPVVIVGPYGVEAEAILPVEVDLEPRPARGAGWDGSAKTP